MMTAKESARVAKTREKIKHQIEEEHQKITPQALQHVSNNIMRWLVRHKPERVALKEKNIALFDANEHPAEVKSKFVTHLLDKLKGETFAKATKDKKPSPLTGRIKSSK